jgi:hypothetical protein
MAMFSTIGGHITWGQGININDKYVYSSFKSRFSDKESNSKYLMQMSVYLSDLNQIGREFGVVSFKKFDNLMNHDTPDFRDRLRCTMEKNEMLMEHLVSKIHLKKRIELLGKNCANFKTYLSNYGFIAASQDQTMAEILEDMQTFMRVKLFGNQELIDKAYNSVKIQDVFYTKHKSLNLKTEPTFPV